MLAFVKESLIYIWFLIGDVPTQMNKKSLESLLFQNGGIKNLSCFSIYKSTCTKLQRCLDGLIDSPLLIINLFLNTHKDKVLESKFQNPGKVKTMAKLLQSILVVDWNSRSDQKNVQDTLNETKTYLDLMNKIFPQPILEAKFEASNQIYLKIWKMNSINGWKSKFWLLMKLEAKSNQTI